MPLLEFSASLPNIQSALRLGGQEGDAVRLQLECLLTPEQVAMVANMRGKELTVAIRYDGDKTSRPGVTGEPITVNGIVGIDVVGAAFPSRDCERNG